MMSRDLEQGGSVIGTEVTERFFREWGPFDDPSGEVRSFISTELRAIRSCERGTGWLTVLPLSLLAVLSLGPIASLVWALHCLLDR